MHFGFFAMVFFVILISSSSWAGESNLKDNKKPDFFDYKVAPLKFVAAENVDLNSYPEAKMMRTRLREAFKKPADLAQKYVVMEHGCGTQCMVSWIVDKENGKIVDGPLTHSFGFSYKKDSNLIIVDPDPNPCKKEDAWFCQNYNNWGYKPRYYILANDKLTSLNVEK